MTSLTGIVIVIGESGLLLRQSGLYSIIHLLVYKRPGPDLLFRL